MRVFGNIGHAMDFSSLDNSTSDLFDREDVYRPLADRMRPTTLEGFVGQAHLLARDKPLRRAIEQGKLH